jgi:hypothetical protein
MTWTLFTKLLKKVKSRLIPCSCELQFCIYCVLCCRHNDGSSKWYKFDDGEVSECKMDDEEEMKTQCFGGDYMGEVSRIFLCLYTHQICNKYP